MRQQLQEMEVHCAALQHQNASSELHWQEEKARWEISQEQEAVLAAEQLQLQVTGLQAAQQRHEEQEAEAAEVQQQMQAAVAVMEHDIAWQRATGAEVRARPSPALALAGRGLSMVM